MKIYQPVLIAIAIATLARAPALAWGDEGHEIVGLIAEHDLSPAVKQKVLDLLATQSDNLAATDTGDPIADQATWADKYRDSDRNTTHIHYDQTHNWHFVDIELSHADLDSACNNHPALPPGTAASIGISNDCVVDKINQFESELADSTTAPPERLMALRFLLHFVGDLHQPLHAADDNDQGGNAKRVRGGGLPSNKLHHHWDTTLVERLGTDPKQVASTLLGQITAGQRASWSTGTPETWAHQSFLKAKADAYGALPHPDPNGTYVVSANYVSKATKDAALQLKRAGVRLAVILNRALK